MRKNLGIAAVLLSLTGHTGATGAAVATLPDPAIDTDRNAVKGRQTAVLAGGCFWCTEAVFEQLNGVAKVI